MDELGLLTGCFLILMLAMTGSILFWSFKLGIPPTPTSPKVLSTLQSVLPEVIHGTVYELGSGFGTLLPTLSKHYPQQNIIGYERSTIPSLISRYLTRHQRTVIIRKENFFRKEFRNEISKAGLIVCYLHPKAMKQLAPIFQEHLPENCVVISHTFHLPGWTPIKEIKSDDLYRTSVFVYQLQQLLNPTDKEVCCRHLHQTSDTSPAAPANN